MKMNFGSMNFKECHLNADAVSSKLQDNNFYIIAKRNVERLDVLYQP